MAFGFCFLAAQQCEQCQMDVNVVVRAYMAVDKSVLVSLLSMRVGVVRPVEQRRS